MSNTVIKVEEVGKLYKLGEIGTGTISHDLNRWLARLKGKEDPFAKIGEINDRTAKGTNDWVWALKDINFEVKQGEVLGIIGRNGAGKSTLLKILSKVTTPSTGRIKIKGRIASLLEVGTGFHQELTGRENIFLNGAILGMTKAEIRSKFDEIVDFSGVERYIDTPVKRYSSGMYVRLAFAVAAFLEPEILIIDEVLAVGDAEFQKKCLGRMKDVSRNDGRTVLFVSHNMAAVKQLCTQGIILKQGVLDFEGNAIDAVNSYQNGYNTNTSIIHTGKLLDAIGNDNIRIIKFEVKPLQGEVISISSGLEFSLEFCNLKEDINLATTFELRSIDETVVFHHGHWICENNTAKKGVYKISGSITPNILNGGTYKFSLIFAESLHSVLLFVSDIIQFEVLNEPIAGNNQLLPGVIRPDLSYKVSFYDDKRLSF